MNSKPTTFAILALLITAAAPARAQRWGGGGPGVSQPATSARVIYRGPVVVAPYAAMNNRGAARQTNGGSWDGRRPTWGGSPPAQATRPAPDYSGFFGYVPPRGQVINQNAQVVVPPQQSQNVSRARRRP